METEDTQLQKGFALFQQGRHSSAKRIFERLIRQNPNNCDALHYLGIVKASTGELPEAKQLIERSLSNGRTYLPYVENYVMILLEAGEHQRAVQLTTQTIESMAQTEKLRYVRALSLYKLRRLEDAAKECDALLRLAPNNFDGHVQKAVTLTEMGLYDEALACIERALRINPGHAQALINKANIVGALGKHDEAIGLYLQTLELNSFIPNALIGLANVYRKLKRYDEALSTFGKLLSVNADVAEAWLGRANTLRDLRRYGEAFATYEKAISLKPDLAGIYTNLGYMLSVLGRNAEALASFDKAVELDPADLQAHLNRGLVLLALGHYQEGWEEYEWRKKIPGSPWVRNFPEPALLSPASANGSIVLIYGEQGLGDHIQFCRYTKLFADLGARVILEVPKPLIQLFNPLAGVSQLIERGHPIPSFDYHCSIMSLPHVFRTALDSVPSETPYLFAKSEKVRKWASRLGEKAKLRIGLVWSGGFNPNEPELWGVNQRRNIPLAKFEPLKGLDVEFYSLQKGEPAASELRILQDECWKGPTIIDLTDEIDDFSDTAALIENLDLVVSVDTSTAHLAGAMGKPVWLLNRFDVEWRWLSNSPWYPTVKLYRQERPYYWDAVIEHVRADILAKIQEFEG